MLRTSRILFLSRRGNVFARGRSDWNRVKDEIATKCSLGLRDDRKTCSSALMTVPARHSMGFVGCASIVEDVRIALFGGKDWKNMTVKGLKLNTFMGLLVLGNRSYWTSWRKFQTRTH